MSSREPHPADAPLEPLTRREREILGLLAQGLSGPEIAEKLTLAKSSVKWHIQQLYGKLGVNSKEQALLRAQELGLLGSPGPSATPEVKPAPKHNLPREFTHFFGREAEISQLKTRLGEHRLVTLTGSGGVGKTRLSLRIAEEVLEDFKDGVWFVALAPLSDPALVPQQISSSLGLHDHPGRPILEALTNYLSDRQLLLVLDNCEHLLTATAQIVNTLLQACSQLHILASSREPLSVSGEAVMLVPSLSFPDRLMPPELMSDFAAVKLFVDRAHLVLPDYQVVAQNAAALTRICQRLDGIPLAIEMAAARLRLLSTEALAARLDDTFRLLTGGSRNALPRQQTLRATIDWSYNLLSPDEQHLLQRLSVFAGGCTLEAAEVVCAGEGLAGDQVLGLLASLVEKSMLVADQRGDQEMRYRLLEIVRQFAQEKLASGGESARLRGLHRDYFVNLAERAAEKFLATDLQVVRDHLTAEQDNFRLALEWSFSDPGESDATDAGPRLINALGGYTLGTPKEWLDWCQRALEWCQRRGDVPALVYARLLGINWMWLARDDLQAGIAGLKEAVELSRRLGRDGGMVLMSNLMALGNHVASQDDIEQASAAYSEAEAIFHDLGKDYFAPDRRRHTQARFAEARARLASKQGLYLEAKLSARASLDLDVANGQKPEFETLIQLAEACLELGEYDQAEACLLQAWPKNSEAPERWYPGLSAFVYVKRDLGIVKLRQGNMADARSYCRASLQAANKSLYRPFVATGIALAAGIQAAQGHGFAAARLSGAAQAIYASTGRPPWEDSSLDTLLPGWRDGLDAAAITAAFEAGQAMTAEQAVAYALTEVEL